MNFQKWWTQKLCSLLQLLYASSFNAQTSKEALHFKTYVTPQGCIPNKYLYQFYITKGSRINLEQLIPWSLVTSRRPAPSQWQQRYTSIRCIAPSLSLSFSRNAIHWKVYSNNCLQQLFSAGRSMTREIISGHQSKAFPILLYIVHNKCFEPWRPQL